MQLHAILSIVEALLKPLEKRLDLRAPDHRRRHLRRRNPNACGKTLFLNNARLRKRPAREPGLMLLALTALVLVRSFNHVLFREVHPAFNR